ncbi:ferritin, heavy subunit-like [Anopheles ziemanni]|uniref:ferritin, heavy subunit-like n=1 Tax=Anopheles coustani TaxID=139045 RepID=UPI00265A13FC|nr:ferritin, heavy subunit-like [Anopheles coustani]XP_058177747.1 ferritin, heavy subunit-like [Anopheles ziemanni]
MFSIRPAVYLRRCFSSIRIPASGQKESNLVPRSLPEQLVLAINGQINEEYYASYMYRSISYHFATSSVCLLGLSELYRKLASEEIGHAESLADFLLFRNNSVTLETIAKPPERQWSSNIGQTLCETIELEMKLSGSISLVYEVAEKQRDVVLMDFLTKHFLHQQCDSLRTLQQLSTKWSQLRAAPDGTYRFDREVRNWILSSNLPK